MAAPLQLKRGLSWIPIGGTGSSTVTNGLA